MRFQEGCEEGLLGVETGERQADKQWKDRQNREEIRGRSGKKRRRGL